ncbi:MAG: pro-sigmaK processing inhibitor BofA [Tissierellia bacterium]|nr:pro-sigmaK processing inhibitor BofA [Tissierellia bacterium]
MDLSVASLLAFLVGLVALYIIGLLLVIPLKFLIKLLINAIIGGALLFIFNVIAGLFGLSIIINPFNALIVGILGIPGLVLLLVLQLIL